MLVVLRDMRVPCVEAMPVVFEDSILLPHVPPLEPSYMGFRCHYDRDIPPICLTKNRCRYTEYSTSISFQLGVMRQWSGLIEHRETEQKETASQTWKKKDFS